MELLMKPNNPFRQEQRPRSDFIRRRVASGGHRALLLVVASLCACAQVRRSASDELDSVEASGKTRGVITLVSGQLGIAGPNLSLYDAIIRLHPSVISQQGESQAARSGGPVVYVNGVLTGSVDELRSLAATSVRSVRLVPGEVAQRRFGPGHKGGAILVLTVGR
jgi:hypothetical protein